MREKSDEKVLNKRSSGKKVYWIQKAHEGRVWGAGPRLNGQEARTGVRKELLGHLKPCSLKVGRWQQIDSIYTGFSARVM
jgi:hypothetical protein